MISLTGCEAVYNLDINNNTFTEELVLTTNDKSSKSQKTVNVALKSKIPVDDNYYKPEVNFKQNNLKYYQISKIDTDNELGARYKANLTKEEYLTSTLVKEHFPNFKLNETGNIISLNLGKKENIFDNYPDLDKLTINITINNKVTKHNKHFFIFIHPFYSNLNRFKNCFALFVFGFVKNVSGSASSMIFPSSKKIIRSAIARANSISCVTITIVLPSLARERITSNTSRTISGSRAAVTSSNNKISGFIQRARTIATRCFCPPDN